MSDYQEVLDYIEGYWEQCVFSSPKFTYSSPRNILMNIGRMPMPHEAVAPNHTYFAYTQFYWDTYFTVLGLIDSGRHELAKGMVDNLIFLFSKFGFIPARNSRLSIGRTQPPFLTSMVWEIYDNKAGDDVWLDKCMKITIQEYENVWNSKPRYITELGLSTYHPRYLTSYLTTYESGWDVSSRFAPGKQNIVPIDLNSLLYKYEKDILRWATLRKNKSAIHKWQSLAEKRRVAITKYMWNKQAGFFYDYDAKSKRQSSFSTIAGFFPLWAGLATNAQAEASCHFLPKLEHNYGVATTESQIWRGRQWDYPNGWPPLQFVTVSGLRNYGFESESNRLTKKWLDLQLKLYKETGTLWEKYDVVNGRVGLSGKYPTQPGFSWTNAVFLRLLSMYNPK